MFEIFGVDKIIIDDIDTIILSQTNLRFSQVLRHVYINFFIKIIF